MIIDRNVMEAMIIFLYKIEEWIACEALFKVYKKSFPEKLPANMKLRVVRGKA